MKIKSKNHGILIGYGMLISKPKEISTRWNKMLEQIKERKKDLTIDIEENCVDHIFIYDTTTSILISNILSWYPTKLQITIPESNILFDFLMSFEIQPVLDTYLIHIWR